MASTRKPDGVRLLGLFHLWAIVAAVVVLLSSLPVAAEFYRYTDADGQVYYVDDPRHIPDSQLDTMRVYPDEGRGDDARDGRGGEEARRGEGAAAAAAPEDERGDLAPSASNVRESPVIVRGNRVLVPVVIGHFGRKIQTHLLFDTGASFTILHQSVARQVMLAGTETREAVVVGGSRIPIRMAEVDFIQIGPHKIPDAKVAIIRNQGPDQGHQGLLGMNILRHLDYTLDVNRRVIVWNR